MRKIVTLGLREARALAPDFCFRELSQYGAITPGAARLLVRAKPRCGIQLWGLKILTPEVAGIFAKCEGPLGLLGLETLTPKAARALSKSSLTRIDLGGLKYAGIKIFSALRVYPGYIGLDGLKYLSDLEAKILVRFAAWKVGLSGLTRVSAASRLLLTNALKIEAPQLRSPRGILKLLTALFPRRKEIAFEFWAEKSEWLGLFLKEEDLWGGRMSRAERLATIAVENFDWDELWEEMRFYPESWGNFQSTATVHLQIRALKSPRTLFGQKLEAGFRGVVIRGTVVDSSDKAAVALSFRRRLRIN